MKQDEKLDRILELCKHLTRMVAVDKTDTISQLSYPKMKSRIDHMERSLRAIRGQASRYAEAEPPGIARTVWRSIADEASNGLRWSYEEKKLAYETVYKSFGKEEL